MPIQPPSIGDRVAYYAGTITAFDKTSGLHTLSYDDGDVEHLVMKAEVWRYTNTNALDPPGTVETSSRINTNATATAASTAVNTVSVTTGSKLAPEPELETKIIATAMRSSPFESEVLSATQLMVSPDNAGPSSRIEARDTRSIIASPAAIPISRSLDHNTDMSPNHRTEAAAAIAEEKERSRSENTKNNLHSLRLVAQRKADEMERVRSVVRPFGELYTKPEAAS